MLHLVYIVMAIVIFIKILPFLITGCLRFMLFLIVAGVAIAIFSK